MYKCVHISTCIYIYMYRQMKKNTNMSVNPICTCVVVSQGPFFWLSWPPQQGGCRFAGKQRAQRSSKTQASLGGVQSEAREARGARETQQGVGGIFGS